LDTEGEEFPIVGRRIALGFEDYLDQFATRQDAEPWIEFAKDDPLNWRFILLELVDDPTTTILFNLHGVDVPLALSRAATGRPTPTDWELFQIHEHPSWWPRIEWWDEDVRVSNPFD
jgi:hypothetical protein